MVQTPISSSEATRVDLRPTRSPKWPNSAEPRGRARKAIPKVRKAESICAVPDVCGKNTGPITSAAAVAYT
ncbi:hypothetical protein D3C80_1311950 [compost metagenome]